MYSKCQHNSCSGKECKRLWQHNNDESWTVANCSAPYIYDYKLGQHELILPKMVSFSCCLEIFPRYHWSSATASINLKLKHSISYDIEIDRQTTDELPCLIYNAQLEKLTNLSRQLGNPRQFHVQSFFSHFQIFLRICKPILKIIFYSEKWRLRTTDLLQWV